MKYVIILLALCALASCSKDDKRMKERASVEGESSSRSQIRVENENLSNRAEQMERDLQRRHRFYQAIKGTYEGQIVARSETYGIRVTFTPSLAPMAHSRVRQLEEIASDLNNLTLNAQILQWDARNEATAIGCRVSSIRPDIEKGTVAISAESCPNLYLISVTEREQRGTSDEMAHVAQRLAEQVLSAGLDDIDSINGTVRPSTNARVFEFVAKKIVE